MDHNLLGLETALKEIRNLISKGDIKEAIKSTKTLGIFKDIYQIEARYNTLQRENIKGTLSHAEYTLELNRISDSLLKIVNNPIEVEKKIKNKALYIVIGVLFLTAIVYASIQLLPGEEKLILIEKDGKYGYTDENGLIIIPITYETADEFIDSIAEVGMGDFTWKINMRGECVFDCFNIEKYNKSLNDKSRFDKIIRQARNADEQLREKCNEYKKWIDNKVLIDITAKQSLLSNASQVDSFYKQAIAIDSIAKKEYENFGNYWKSIEKKIIDAYLPNPKKWYNIQFPGYKNSFIAVNALKEGELLCIRKKPRKESYSRFKFISHPDFKNWYYVQTVDNYFWHSIKRPSHYTDSGIQLIKTNKKSITETFIIANIGDGKITLKGEGHDATGGRKQGVLSISQKGNNNRPDGSPLHLWEYLGGGDQKLKLIQVD